MVRGLVGMRLALGRVSLSKVKDETMGIDRDFDSLRDPAVIAFTKVALPYGWMGNMSPHPITLVGRTWRSSEALFQAGRFSLGDPIREEIRAQTSPMAAKMVAKREKDKMVVIPQSQEDLQLME